MKLIRKEMRLNALKLTNTHTASDNADLLIIEGYGCHFNTVNGNGESTVNIYPNPVMGEANLAVNAAMAGNATLRIYDLNGRMVAERRLGYVNEGEQLFTIGTEGMAKGMYLVNVIIGGHTAASKMIVR
jgi:hypothetical protein